MGAFLAEVLDLDFVEAADVLPALGEGLRAGTVIPYLGPQPLTGDNPDIPTTPEMLAAYF